MRATALFLFVLSSAQADDTLKPTAKELATIIDTDDRSAERQKLLDKYDNRLVELKGTVHAKREPIPGTKTFSEFFAFHVDTNARGKLLILWGKDTEKTQEEIRKGSKILTIRGRLALTKTGTKIEGVTVQK